MRSWTLERINEIWVLKDDIDREHGTHKIYGTDPDLGAFVLHALNQAEAQQEDWRQQGKSIGDLLRAVPEDAKLSIPRFDRISSE